MVKVYRNLIFCLAFSFLFFNSQAQKLYFSDGGDVKRINLDGTGVQTVVTGSPYDYNYIAVDGYNNLLFYNNGQETYSSKLDGTSPAQLTNDGAFAGYSNIAVVPDYEVLIYAGITDDQDDLWRGSYYDDPGTPPVLLTTGINMGTDEEYYDIAYNSSEEKIYVTGYDGNVYSCYQDGTGAGMISGSTLASGPIGVDHSNDKVYWVQYSAGTYSIWMANLDGSGASSILSNGGASIESLEVYPEQNAVFFAQTNAIYRIALNGAGKTAIFTGTYITNVAINYDIVPPAFYALSPTDGSITASISANFTLTFNENVKRSVTSPGTSDEFSFRIYKTAGDVLVETLDRTSSNISISDYVVTINPTSDLEYNTDYYILAGNKTISDFTDNNWIGVTQTTGWNFKTEPDESIFYSRQNGSWDDQNTWSHIGHSGLPASTTPGTGSDVIIGAGHTVTLGSNTAVVANTATGTWIMSGATLDAASYDFEVWGTLRIDGQLVNGGVLSGDFNLYSTGGIPIFNEIQYGVSGIPGAQCDIYTHVVALNGIQSIDGGTINTNGFQICIPPTPSPTVPVFGNVTQTSVTLSWTSGGGQAFVVARQGSTSVKPTFGQAYTANAIFGSGQDIGSGNFLVYSGSGNTVTITGLAAGTDYEFDLYSFSTSIGGCYSIQNYEMAAVTSCIVLPAPTGAVNAQYCTGDTKPSLNVTSPGAGKRIRWYDAPTGGNIVLGNSGGGDGLGEVFIPTAPSGTFYAETYDEGLLCASATRTAVTLTLHPPLVAGTPSADQNVCSGGDPAIIDGGMASGGTGAYTYVWASASAAAGPYTPIGGATSTTYDPPPGITQTTYYHRITRSATCLQTGNPVMVSVVTAPTITAQPTGSQACEGEIATISLSATGTSLTYQWQSDIGTGYTTISNGGIYSGATTNQLSIANVTGLDNVRYQCIVTSGGSCPVISNAVALVVNASPAVVNQTQAVCELTAGSGTSIVDLTALNSPIVSGASGYTISWYTNAALSNPVADPTNAATSNNTMFYARVVNNSTGCSNTANASITVNNKPSGSGIVSGPLTICTNVESTYTVTGIGNATQYQWQASDGLEVLSQSGASVTIQAASGTSGTITVMGENSCGNGGSGNLVVQILPALDVEIVAPSEVIVNEPADFSLETSAAFQSILWDFGDSGSATEAAAEHIYTADGTYTVTLTVTDKAGCETTRTKTIIVSPVPDLTDTNIKNVITANGDDSNGFLYIENIEKFPSNQVVLLDRWGVEVFRKENYVNDWDARKNGEFLPAGQYVCVVKLNETGKVFTRTVSIIKRK
jgi:gliding motility-associated-like protein